MTGLPASVPPRRVWTAARVLKAMLAAQCLLAFLVVAGDLPGSLLDPWTRSPATEGPVTPGNQTRRFDPGHVQIKPLTGPGLPTEGSLSPRLEFLMTEIDGHKDAALLTGAIAAGDALRFDTWLKGLAVSPGVFVVQSPGGVVDEALAIGRIIRATETPVVIPSGASCLSACPYILAGGARREVSRRAQVGVHQHYFDENVFLPAFLMVSDIQAGQGEVMAYLAEMGIDPMLMARALMTPPEDIYILMPEELETFRLATTLVD